MREENEQRGRNCRDGGQSERGAQGASESLHPDECESAEMLECWNCRGDVGRRVTSRVEMDDCAKLAVSTKFATCHLAHRFRMNGCRSVLGGQIGSLSTVGST